MAVLPSDHDTDTVKEKNYVVALTHASITYYNTFVSFSRLGATATRGCITIEFSEKRGPHKILPTFMPQF